MRLRPYVESAEKLDDRVANSKVRPALEPTMFHWSATVRSALGVAAVDLAGRLGISQSAMTQLEKSEAAGTISLAKLRAIADALRCDLVYGFVPRTSFADEARRYEATRIKARKAKRKLPRPDLRSN